MILTDTGPIVAIIDRLEANHARCIQALRQLRSPMVTTWPAFTECMHLAYRAGGWPAQRTVWSLVDRSELQVAALGEAAAERMHQLMETYRNIPMSLADASLVILAEERRVDRIFTLDGDFHIYRLPGNRAFTVLP